MAKTEYVNRKLKKRGGNSMPPVPVYFTSNYFIFFVLSNIFSNVIVHLNSRNGD